MATKLGTSLVASGNTYNPSLIVLREKGYELWLESRDDGARNGPPESCGGGSLWCAKKGRHRFMAFSGPELLGLVVLWEHLGENWNQQEPDIYSELIDKMED